MSDSTALYNASELAAQARKIFSTTPEVVTAALRTAGKEAAAVEEAREIIRTFLNREVK